ncbi:MAG: hypothetical protein QXT66_08440 [Nitrososphaerota archaeon]
MATNTISIYRPLCETLGLSDDCLYGKVALADLLLHVDFTAKLRSIICYVGLYGKVALANLLLHIDFSAGLRKILCYVGLYKPSNGRYNHRLRTAVQSIAISHYRKNKVKAREARQLLKKIKQTMAGGPA